MVMILKQNVRNNVLNIALCDSDLIGLELEEGKLYLNLNSSFYKGDEVDEKTALDFLKKCKSAIIVGKESINVAKKFDDEFTVSEIKGIPFCNLIKI